LSVVLQVIELQQCVAESLRIDNAKLYLFLEVERDGNLQPVPPPEKLQGDILHFVKVYEPENEELRYLQTTVF
ncbi:unnamed protein product, partial [Linum tenue]